ncbi:hypothetical protein N7474_001721 [Penicillium riverlandense]|uniref:uncharacterized protein n=1 Tax=Penicillium riverlandense TaxID=1903569 RepID=UPI002546DB01|nr:uncharacterized protein N7474_001721 [Penicillium riverlandense]KAJ5833410.1 hypothetical protein N7474_001721 [Penicillium riverlandense]
MCKNISATDKPTEICYNISENLSYTANNTSPLESSSSVSSSGPTDMKLRHQYEPIYFRYDFLTGHTLYILPKSKGDLRDLIHAIGERFKGSSQERSRVEELPGNFKQEEPLHPLILHSVVMFYILSSRNAELENLIKWLLWIETQLHQGSIFEVTGSERFSRYIQLLHKMSRNLITLEHNNQRDASNINHLLRDHERLGRLAELHGTDLDHTTDQRVRDDLLMLHDLCDDRHRRIMNLQRRTNNFVTLLYNLITGHDSTINLKIATESAKIAQDARKDSVSMKIIAGMTLLYLPATFVCSLFGTNLIALDTSTDNSEPLFVVSHLWWLYLAFAVPLTVFTMFGFLLWRRFREQYPGKRASELDVS